MYQRISDFERSAWYLGFGMGFTAGVLATAVVIGLIEILSYYAHVIDGVKP